MLGQSLVARIVFRAFLFVVVVLMTDVDVYGAGYLVDVTKFGAVADAKKVDQASEKTANESARNIPIAYGVDGVVVGGSSAGVAVAVEAAQKGASVFLAAPQPYLGEDPRATYHLRLEPSSSLAMALFAEVIAGVPFTYEVDKPSAGEHKDTEPPSRLTDGLYFSAAYQSVQYNSNVNIIADMSEKHSLRKVHVLTYQRDNSFEVESVTVFISNDKQRWKEVAVIVNEGLGKGPVEHSSIDLWASVMEETRYVKFFIKKGPNAYCVLLGEIVIEGVEQYETRIPPSPMQVKHTPGAEYLLDVTRFGAVADAKKVDGVWVGTDNSKAINACAAYCRANGLTMFFPKGNYGVASTIWLTNPEMDKLRQASITVVGPNRGAYFSQSYSANICVLKNFKPGKIVEVRKKNGVVKEPYIVPVLAVSNGRQVHIEGLGIQGNNKSDLICGLVIGNISQFTSVRNCSIQYTYAGIVFPGLRPSMGESVVEGNNDLLVVEQSTFDNAYNIICAGTQPFVCEYRNSIFKCTRSAFTGTLITNYYGHSRGSHKFSSNLFGTRCDAKGQEVVYFDLAFNEIKIDSCHFETGCAERQIPEVLIRLYPKDGVAYQTGRLAFTNNFVNFANRYKYPSKYRPLIDTLAGNRMIIQGNNFNVATSTRIKAYGAVFIGNAFRLVLADHDLKLIDDVHPLVGSAGDIKQGLYDFNHFIREDSKVRISLPSGTLLKSGVDYEVKKDFNAFKITKAGKEKIDRAKSTHVLVSYSANDASHIGFEAWGGNRLNPLDGWRSRDLTMIANKVVGKTDSGHFYESELRVKHESAINE